MNVRRLVIGLVVLAIFFVLSRPQGSADFVLTILGRLRDAGDAIITFLQTLF